MSRVTAHTWYMIGRQTRNLLRQPIWIALLLIQPMIWLLLYGQLFKNIARDPAFQTSYIEFQTPGIIVKNAFFGATWSGMAMIEDLDRRVIERFLATPASRLSLVLSQVVRAAMTSAFQALVILLVGLALGAHVTTGVVGWIAVLCTGALVGMAFGGFSHGLALIVRREASMIGIANFIGLPLLFLSSTLQAPGLIPHWMQQVTRFNPVNWGVVAARIPFLPHPDWAQFWIHLGLLAALAIVSCAFATRAFRVYQRSL